MSDMSGYACEILGEIAAVPSASGQRPTHEVKEPGGQLGPLAFKREVEPEVEAEAAALLASDEHKCHQCGKVPKIVYVARLYYPLHTYCPDCVDYMDKY